MKLSLRNLRSKSSHSSQKYRKTVGQQKNKKNKTIHNNHNSNKKVTKTMQKLAEKLLLATLILDNSSSSINFQQYQIHQMKEKLTAKSLLFP